MNNDLFNKLKAEMEENEKRTGQVILMLDQVTQKLRIHLTGILENPASSMTESDFGNAISSFMELSETIRTKTAVLKRGGCQAVLQAISELASRAAHLVDSFNCNCPDCKP